MNADDILTQIDNALGDWTVSGDAMRSRPADETESELTAGPQVWIVSTTDDPDSGGWEQVDGILDATIDPATIDPATMVHQPTVTWDDLRRWWSARIEAERAQRAREMLEALGALQAMGPAVEEAGRGIAAITEALQRPSTPAARRDDRPAWQSPYGPRRR